jgi:glutamine amidotransferase
VSGPKIAVLDYGIGNLRSAEKALQHVGAAARLVSDPTEVEAADAVVLPGVGAFGACARALADSGLEPAARGAIGAGLPFLAVCIGFQLLYQGSDESPDAVGLGVFDGRVVPLAPGVKHPQMQWNQLQVVGASDGDGGPAPLHGLGDTPWVYFVHSYAPPVGAETVAVCDYGGPVAALLANFVALAA